MSIIHVIIKDIKLILKKPFNIFVILILPLLYLFIFSFINSSSTKNLILYADSKYSNVFKNKNSINVLYMGKNIKIKIKYYDIKILFKNFNNNKYPVIFTVENNKNTVYVNQSNQKAITIYNLLNFYFTKDKNIIFKTLKSKNQLMLSLVINMLIIFGALNISINSLSKEIDYRTIFIIKKLGFNNISIIIEKLIFVIIIEYIFFMIFVFIFNMFNIGNLTKSLYFIIPIISLNSAVLGLLIVSIFKEREVHTFIFLLFWIPTMFFPIIEDSISNITKFIFYIDPLMLSTLILKNAFIDKISLKLLSLDLMIVSIFIILTTYFLNLNLKKNF